MPNESASRQENKRRRDSSTSSVAEAEAAPPPKKPRGRHERRSRSRRRRSPKRSMHKNRGCSRSSSSSNERSDYSGNEDKDFKTRFDQLSYQVVHAAVGLVPSGVATTLAQVYSRVFLVCGALLATASAPRSPGLPLAVLAWSITEIIRYAYYALNLVKLIPHFLLVTRYSTFLALYPLGVTGELLYMYHALAEVEEHQLLSVAMPNRYNFVFSYYHFLIFYMFLYIPLFPVLFGHMMSQRRKMLGSDPKKTH